MHKTWTRVFRVAVTAVSFVLLLPTDRSLAAVDSTCSTSTSPTTFSGAGIDTATPSKSGVVYDAAGGTLKLDTSGAAFRSATLGVSDQITYGCAADFDDDSWTDFVGAGDDPNEFIKFYKNRTYENPAPTWSDPNQVRTPKFVPTVTVESSSSSSYSRGVMACGDFNNDGKQDFVYARCDSGQTCQAQRADLFRGKGDGTFSNSYTFIEGGFSNLQHLSWNATNVAVADYNGDGWLDLIWGAGYASTNSALQTSNGGDVLILINKKGGSPKFNNTGSLLTNAGYNYRGPVALAYADFTGDGVKDLVTSGPSTDKMRLYPGLLGGGVSTGSAQTIAFSGGATVLLAADFSLDGKPDFIVGTDNWNWPVTNGFNSGGHEGGKSFYYTSDGTGTPFSAGASQTLSVHQDPHSGSALYDFDLGMVMDYDHDPSSTPDAIVLDGGQASNYFMFANRPGALFATCGSVASAVLDIGALATTEMTVSDVRISPTESVPAGTSITWEASNDNGTTWHAAMPCASNPADYCASFTTSTGNQIRWRATLCSNASRTATPTVSSVSVDYAYVTAEYHFRSGVVPRDGVVYVGAFREPGSAGAFFAISDETGATLWDAGAILDTTAVSARSLYTVAADGSTRLDFTTANAGSASLRATLLAATSAEVTAIVNWFASARFGLTTGSTPPRVLGGIESSTPAVVTQPKPPTWYANNATSAAERAAVDAFLDAYKDRPHIVLVGAKDGALHAFRTDSLNLADPYNGTEAFAFIPYDVAQRINGDRLSGTVNAYPDGSPTVADVKIGGQWRTVVVMGEGNGGRGLFALDITEGTLSAGKSVWNPQPLWHFQDPNMGFTRSKATIVRTQISGSERWLAVFSSGPGNGIDVGDTVYAVDMTTGQLVWRFDLNDTNAYISTSITAAETDDEAGTVIDGYIDRLFFADNKGRLWKINPASFSGTTMNSLGTVSVGLAPKALFSTLNTAGALGAERAIAGTMAAAEDASNRLVLYFGTGGTEDAPAGVQNAFYAVHADDGTIRSQLGAGDIPVGAKFYGGVVYNDGQLIFSTGSDLSSLGLCAPSAGEIVAIDANTFAEQFVVPTSSKIMAPLFARNGQFYTVTLKGEIVTSAYTGENNGTALANNAGSQLAHRGGVSQAFNMVGWRQVY